MSSSSSNKVNGTYKHALNYILDKGDELETRNHNVISSFNLHNCYFAKTPLVTTRKTAYKKAIREMEWFLSGRSACPSELLDWWDGQLNSNNELLDGYPTQFRHSIYCDDTGNVRLFDQVKFILEGLKNNPNSRRLVISLWNPGEMANMTVTNGNASTPTVCHSVLMQFFVRQGKLFIKSYQRSADMLLGVPHNWIQSWAMLLYFAYHSKLQVGGLIWMFGDAHIYLEDSHKETAKAIIAANIDYNVPELIYEPIDIELSDNSIPLFKAKDFRLSGKVPEPKVLTRPKLI